MTDRTFVHQCTHPSGPITTNDDLGLSPAEIAVAAMHEITQLSLNAAPFNLFLDGLLVLGTPRFRWVTEVSIPRQSRGL
jgi:hypothetical protein